MRKYATLLETYTFHQAAFGCTLKAFLFCLHPSGTDKLVSSSLTLPPTSCWDSSTVLSTLVGTISPVIWYPRYQNTGGHQTTKSCTMTLGVSTCTCVPIARYRLARARGFKPLPMYDIMRNHIKLNLAHLHRRTVSYISY